MTARGLMSLGERRERVMGATVMGQSGRALSRGNSVRFARAERKRQAASSSREDACRLVARALTDGERWAASMLVWQLLVWVPGMGEQLAPRMMRRCGVDSWTRVRRLTVRQRVALVAELEAFALGSRGRRPSARRAGAHECVGCGVHIVRVTPERLCGFCVELRERAR